MPKNTPNTNKPAKAKIMVQWDKHLIIHCMDDVGSDNYRYLISLGYMEVGEIKEANRDKIFWDARYFRPQDKYLNLPNSSFDEITT